MYYNDTKYYGNTKAPRLKLLCYLNGPYYSTNTNITDGKMSINMKIKIPSYIDSPLMKRDIQITETKLKKIKEEQELYLNAINKIKTNIVIKNNIVEQDIIQELSFENKITNNS